MDLLLVIAVFFVGYLISLRIHPLRKCPVCKMTGRHWGSIYTYSYRRCRRCGGTGRLDRWGTQAFFGGTKDTGIYPKK
jgi:DnaJ-class molecular chaperone